MTSRQSTNQDPLGDVDTRRKLRKDYHKLHQETLDSHGDIVKRDREGTKKTRLLLQRGNELHQNIVHAREGALDARWFTITTKYASESVLRIEDLQVWDIEDFTRKLKQKYLGSSEDDPVNWKTLGAVASKYFRRAPTISFMNGPLAVEAKQRKKAVRKSKKMETGQSVRPDEVELEKEKNNEEESTKHVVRLNNRLHKAYRHDGENLSFWRIVLDPQSFTKTIENIFYYSFLVKDGRAGLRMTKDYEVTAAPLNIKDAHQMDRHQSILRLDYNTYLKLVEKYGYLFEDGVNLSTQGGAGARDGDTSQSDEEDRRRSKKRKKEDGDSKKRKKSRSE